MTASRPPGPRNGLFGLANYRQARASYLQLTIQLERQFGDAFDVVETLESGQFNRVIHDPPMFSLAGHLYSQDFYAELYRVLTDRGRLFHYIGDLKSKSGAGVARGVRQRLIAAGFRRVEDKPRAFGVVATK